MLIVAYASAIFKVIFFIFYVGTSVVLFASIMFEELNTVEPFTSFIVHLVPFQVDLSPCLNQVVGFGVPLAKLFKSFGSPEL